MKISRTSKKLTSMILAVIMLVSLLSVGLVVNAANEWTGTYDPANGAVVVTTGYTGVSRSGQGAIIIFPGDQRDRISGFKLNAANSAVEFDLNGGEILGSAHSANPGRWNSIATWYSGKDYPTEFTFTPGLEGVTLAYFTPSGLQRSGYFASIGDPVDIYYAGAKVSGGSVSVEVEEGFVDFSYQSDASSVTWSLGSSANFTLSSTTASTTRVSFDNVGSTTLVATTDKGRTATVTINVKNSNITIQPSLGGVNLSANQEIEVEEGSSIQLAVECTVPEKLTVKTVTGTSATATIVAGNPASVTITGVTAGSSTTFQLELYGKTFNFRVKVIAASTAKFTIDGTEIQPITFIPRGETKTVTSSLNVDRWVAASGGITVTKTGANTCSITGVTIDSLVKVEAYNSDNKLLGWFDVYVSDGDPLFAEIIYSTDFTKVGASYTFDGIGDFESFAAHCSIILGETDVVWSLIPAIGSTGTVSCATLDTSATDANGNKIAVVTAVSKGSCVLKLSANGIDAYLNIVIGDDPSYTDLVFKTFSEKTLLLPGFPNGVNVYENQKVLLAEGNGRTMIPFRFLGEALGASVNYYESTKTVEYILNGKTVSMTIDDPHVTINGSTLALPDYEYEPARLYENDNGDLRTYVHVRLLADAFDLNCEYLAIGENDEGIEIGYIMITNNMTADKAYFQDLSDKAKNVIG